MPRHSAPIGTRLGSMLRIERTVNRQGVRDLAKQIGISPATLSRIERGHAMDAATLLKLWQWLLSASAIPRERET